MSAPRLNFPYGSGGGGGGVSGSGTPNALAMWATSSSLTDSPLSFSGSTLTYSSALTTHAFAVPQTWTLPGNTQAWRINGQQLVFDGGSGYLGINPPTSPAAPLHVEGSVTSSELVRLRNTSTSLNSPVAIQMHAANRGATTPTGKLENYPTSLTLGYGTYDWVYSLPDPSNVMTEVFRQTAPTTILTVTLTSGGSGYTDGTYAQVALTNVSSSGSGATADIVVSGGIVTAATLRSGGSTYQVGNTLTCASIGGGTGFVLTVASVGSRATAAGNITATRIGAGIANPSFAVDALGVISSSKTGALSYPIFNNGAASYVDVKAGVVGTSSGELNGVIAIDNSGSQYTGALFSYAFDASAASSNYGPTGLNVWAAANRLPSAGTQQMSGVQSNAKISTTLDTGKTAIVNGFSSSVSVDSAVPANTYNPLRGYLSTVSVFSSNVQTVATLYHFDANTTSLSGAAHVVNTGYGMRVRAVSLANGSTIGTWYGIRLDAQPAGITNRWGISQEDTLATNYFAGSVGVGVGAAAPFQKLHVAGGFVVSGTATLGATASAGTFSLESSSTFRQYTGDGTGWTWAVSKRSGSVTTDILSVNDSTNAVTAIGPVRATGTAASAVAFSGAGDPNTGMYFPTADTVRIAAGASIGMEIDSNGVFSINNGYGGLAPAYGCRAWVNFDSTVSGSWAGGVSTVTRAAGSTTATVTTTSNHGLITGNSVYALSGVAVGYYTITYVGVKTFTITTVATTALSAVPITFAVNNIRASGGVSSVTDISTGIFSVNFSTAMPDINYSAIGIKQNVSSNSNVSLYDCLTTVGSAPGRTTTQCGWQCIESAVATDSTNVNIAVFR